MIRTSFPFWDQLHPFWRELPNYNPIGISNSRAKGGLDLQEMIGMRGNDDGSDVSNTDRGDGKTGDGAEELASDEDSGIETNTFVESVNLSEASSL